MSRSPILQSILGSGATSVAESGVCRRSSVACVEVLIVCS